MSGFDKYMAGKDLIAQGWTEGKENYYSPPEALVEAFRRGVFWVYEARDLQAMIQPVDDEATTETVHSESDKPLPPR